MSFLNDLLEATSESETPKPFIFWAGLSAIAAITKNKVFWDKYFYKVYPNIYVLLVGRSGTRKSFATWTAERLVEAVGNTRVISGRNSIQAIVTDLSRSYHVEGQTMKDSAAFLVSNEFSNLIIDDPSAMGILTELYDGQYKNETAGWTNTLKSSGKEKLKDISLTMLGAMTPAHFKEKITQVSVEGGFVGRTIIVEENRKSHINPLLVPPSKVVNIQELAVYLKQLAKVSGQTKLTEGASALYEKFYRALQEKIDSGEEDDKAGVANRLHDQVSKIAMLLSLSRSTDLLINEEDITQAINACRLFNANIERLTVGSGKSQMAHQQAKIIELLINADGFVMSRAKLLQKLWGDLNASQLDEILQTMLDAEIIETKLNQGFKLRETFIIRWTNWKAKKEGKSA